MSGRKPLFNSNIEEELVSVIKLLAERGFPLAVQNGIPGFSKKQVAGYEWLTAFL